MCFVLEFVDDWKKILLEDGNDFLAETAILSENRLRQVPIFEEYKRCGKRLIVSGVWIARRSATSP
jgi:hypothetical protein